MNILETIEKLSIEAAVEGKRKDKRIDILSSELEHSELKCRKLADNYIKLHDDYSEVESMLSLAKLNNKSLLGELSDMQKGIEAVESTNELLSDRDRLLQDEINRLQKVERENEVLKKDLAKSQAQVKRAKSAKPKQGKLKVSAYRDVQRKLKETQEVLQISPRFMQSHNHSEQGIIRIIDTKPAVMLVNGEKQIVQQLFIANKYNSVKSVYRSKGIKGLTTFKLPKGCTVQIDDEMKDVIEKRFQELDKLTGEKWF